MQASYVIHNRWALGDTVCLSALARDIQIAYPGKFRISMSGHYSNVFWQNNPHVTPPDGTGTILRFDYKPGIEASNLKSKKHFLTWFHHDFEQHTGIHVPVFYPKGDIHLSPEEKVAKITGKYWVVLPGGKTDITIKVWAAEKYQAVVNQLRKYGIVCVQAGATFTNHINPILQNCHQLLGKTLNERDFFSLIYNAEGVICGVTSAMHIAACFDKPCVVVAGGRESPWWEEYSNEYGSFGETAEKVKVPHKFLHTIGKLDCCAKHGCWKARTVPIEKTDLTNKAQKEKLCLYPVRKEQTIAKCMDMIEPADVVSAVMQYYADGTLELDRAAFVLPVQTDQKIKGKQMPAEISAAATTEDKSFEILDNPAIGGKVTIFVLGWGDNRRLLERCLGKIMETVPEHRRDIRVALNQPSQTCVDYINGFSETDVTKVYVDNGSRRKYPAMRQMFYDKDCPVNTKYIVWFDDDSFPIDALWLPKLAEVISLNHRTGSRLYGIKMFHDLKMYSKNEHRPELWFRRADWWRNHDLRLRGKEQLAANGSCIDFVAGWFWACSYEAIVQCNIPDVRLNHNGGDITIGAQIHQGGYKIKMFNENKVAVFTPPKDRGGRRGYSESFPWANPETNPEHKPNS